MKTNCESCNKPLEPNSLELSNVNMNVRFV
jgi:hypothetical protein